MTTDKPIESPKKKFEIEFFNQLLDTSLTSVKKRFRQLHDYSEIWSFLYNVKNILERNKLLKFCADLQRKLTVGSNSDIDGHLLCDELISLKNFLPDNDDITLIYVLNFIK